MGKRLSDVTDTKICTLYHTSCPSCNSHLSVTEVGKHKLRRCPFCHTNLSNFNNYEEQSYKIPISWIPFKTNYNEVRESLFIELCNYNYSYFNSPKLADIYNLTKIYIPLYLFNGEIKYSYNASCEKPHQIRTKNSIKTVYRPFHFGGNGTEKFELVGNASFSLDLPSPLLKWISELSSDSFGYSHVFNGNYIDNDAANYLVEVYGITTNPSESFNLFADSKIQTIALKAINTDSRRKKPSECQKLSIKSHNYTYSVDKTSSFMGSFWFLSYTINNIDSYYIYEGTGKSSNINHVKSKIITAFIWSHRLIYIALYLYLCCSDLFIYNEIYQRISDNFLFYLFGFIIFVIIDIFSEQFFFALFRRIRFFMAKSQGLLDKQHGLFKDIVIILFILSLTAFLFNYYYFYKITSNKDFNQISIKQATSQVDNNAPSSFPNLFTTTPNHKIDYISPASPVNFVSKDNIKNSRIENEKAIKLIQNEKYSEAIKHLYQANKLDPNNAEILGNLGYAFYKANDPNNALNILSHCLKLKPNRLATLLNLAQINADLGNIDNAEHYYKLYLNYIPNTKKDIYIKNIKKDSMVNKNRHEAISRIIDLTQ